MKTKKEEISRRATRFSCHAAEARAVCLAGSFNDWSPDATPMAKNGQGAWSVRLDLPPGRYEFKFVVDGVWCCEPGKGETERCGDSVPNAFGTRNRVIEVA